MQIWEKEKSRNSNEFYRWLVQRKRTPFSTFYICEENPYWHFFFLFSDPYFTEVATILNLRMHPTDVIYGTTPGNRSLHRKNGANPDDRVRSSKINVATYDNGLDAVEATT